MSRRAALSLALALPLCSCGADRPAREVHPEVEPARLSSSALGATVRALETLDAVRPPGALTQLRALRSDTMRDPASGIERVRVFLELTEYAPTIDSARSAFEELRSALDADGGSSGRIEPAPRERVERVMSCFDWDPPGREDLLSYSDVIRLEVRPGSAAPATAEAGAAAEDTPHESVESYVRAAAAQRIGPVDLSLSTRTVAPGVADHRFRIAPEQVAARFTTADIGEFLSALEHGSPSARVTELKIERSQHEPDVHARRGWTFEAELTVRGTPGESGTPVLATH